MDGREVWLVGVIDVGGEDEGGAVRPLQLPSAIVSDAIDSIGVEDAHHDTDVLCNLGMDGKLQLGEV